MKSRGTGFSGTSVFEDFVSPVGTGIELTVPEDEVSAVLPVRLDEESEFAVPLSPGVMAAKVVGDSWGLR
jgi:hypothetical protein